MFLCWHIDIATNSAHYRPTVIIILNSKEFHKTCNCFEIYTETVEGEDCTSGLNPR